MRKKHRQLNAGDLSILCAQIGMFLRAGVPLADGLALMRGEAGSLRVKGAAEALASAVGGRKTLSQAMEESGLFPGYLVRMTRAGEVSGDLDGVMESMARFYERECRLSEQIRSAVLYPLLLIVMMGAVVFFIVTRVLPMFRDILTELGSELPGAVLALMRAGMFAEQNFLWLLVGIAALVLAVWIAAHTGKGARFLDRCKAKLPICRKIAAARFAGAMSFLLSGGVPMDSALDLGRSMLGNLYMSERLESCLKEIPNGKTIADVFDAAGFFPEKFTMMFSVGFESGEAETAMGKLADLYEKEGDRALARLAGSVEPVLSVLLSILVGVILVSVILPLIRIMAMIG